MKKTTAIRLAAMLGLLGSAVASTGPVLAQATERPVLTKSTIDGLLVTKSTLASRPGEVACFTHVILTGGTGTTPPRLTVTVRRFASGNRSVELETLAIWGATRPVPTIAIGSESVSAPADFRGKSAGYVSLSKNASDFNRLRDQQGTATFSFDGKSYSWTTPSFGSILTTLERCAAI